MAKDTDRVIVSGGGPVAMVTALTLARQGVPVTVVEAEPSIVASPRALVYHPPVLEALNALGLLEDLKAAGITKQGLQFRDIDKHILAEVDYRPLAEVTPFPYNLHLGQDVLAGIVLRHLERLPNSEVLWGRKLVAIAQDADGVDATVETADGRETLRGRWLVGADGAGSGTRQALGLGFDGITWPDRFISTNVHYDFEADGYGRASFVFDPEHWAIIVKIDDGDLWRVTYGESDALPVRRLHRPHRRQVPAMDAAGRELRDRVATSLHRVHERCGRDLPRRPRAAGRRRRAHQQPVRRLRPHLGPARCRGARLSARRRVPRQATRGHPRPLCRGAPRHLDQQDLARRQRQPTRRFREKDPERKAADMARFRRLREDPGFNRQTAMFSFKLASPELANPALLA